MNSSTDLAASHRNQIWSCDFVSDRTADGRPLKILNVVDEFTRLCIGSYLARAVGAQDVAEQLAEIFARRGRPKIIRSDNGREFTPGSLREWLTAEGVAQAFIDRGAPQQNPYVERFNGTMRDEKLNGELVHSVLRGRVVIAEFVTEYH